MGEKFGRYELLRKLAEGGMGEVHLARMEGPAGFEKRVVIKKILRQFSSDPKFVERFIEEGKTLVTLSHGNIVPVFDLGVVDGEYYLAMEYVEGGNLRDAIKYLAATETTMPWHLAVTIVTGVCRALAFAHDRTDDEGRPLHIVHRDISPSNIMVSRHGDVKLVDFGIARSTRSLQHTISGFIEGKVYYMSPEQARGETLDRRTDQFSLGVVFYELLTGRRPFEGENELQVLERIKSGDPVPPHQVVAGIPESLSIVIMRCLAKDREARYAGASELADALQQVLIDESRVTGEGALAEFLNERGFFDAAPEAPQRRLSFDDFLASRLDEERASRSASGTLVGARHTRTMARRRVARRTRVLLIIAAVLLAAVFIPRNVPTTLERPTEPPVLAPFLRPSPRLLVSEVQPKAHVRRALEAPPAAVVVAPAGEAASVSRPAPTEREVRVVSTPPADLFTAEGGLLGRTPLGVRVTQGRTESLTARAEGHRDTAVQLRWDSPREVGVSLPDAARGKVVFRYFPANATVVIDGTARAARGNVVELELDTGDHRLELRGVDGSSLLAKGFVVQPDQTTNLGTLKEEP